MTNMSNMSSDERFGQDIGQQLRAALPPAVDTGPARDLWPLIERRIRQPAAWSWFDTGLAAAISIALALFPGGLSLLLVYHL